MLFRNIALSSALMAVTASAKHFGVKVKNKTTTKNEKKHSNA